MNFTQAATKQWSDRGIFSDVFNCTIIALECLEMRLRKYNTKLFLKSIKYFFFFFTLKLGLVSKPTGQMEEEGAHEERTGATGAQRPSADVFRRTDSGRGAGAQGTRSQGEETLQVAGKAAEETRSQRLLSFYFLLLLLY